ncbi:hypothetical protein XENORESO_000720, partial [Xenotaenia resolanae]
ECGFDSDWCGFENGVDHRGQWERTKGTKHQVDNSYRTENGFYMSVMTSHSAQQEIAELLSPVFTSAAEMCVHFWYMLPADVSNYLAIKVLRSGQLGDALWRRSGFPSKSWEVAEVTVSSPAPFNVVFEAVHMPGINDTVKIDDFSVRAGACASPASCDFESGQCTWVNVQKEDGHDVGQAEWVRTRNGTGNSGPSVDNTLGTELGWYMGLEADRGEEMSPAALQSSILKQASSTCTLHFYYNMYGEESELKVLLKEGSRITTLWWLAGGNEDLWQYSKVIIGRIPQHFSLLFEGSSNFNKLGYVAVDDLDFTNCSLPEPQPWCSESTFMCNNSVCVDPNHVCDFSDDCGDWSDEINCEKQGVVERCNFEQGLCSWANSDVDTPGGEWTRHKGEEGWPNHGPPRDHTENLAAGHYVSPGSHLTEKGQTSEILSKTLLPSFNCTIRFFYFSISDASAQLTAQSRTLMSGIDDKMLWIRESSHSYSWQRAKVTFSSSIISKIAFRYEIGATQRGLVALDDISFSKECIFDPENSKLPETLPTSSPHTSSNTPSATTAPVNPCQDNEFFCRQSAGKVCIPATLQCDYNPDCPEGEDEAGCGFTSISAQGVLGHSECLCSKLRVVKQSYGHAVWFSSISKATGPIICTRDHVVAVDDISFINCETSYEPPALPSYGCTFEDDLCVWIQGAEDELDWRSGSGPTETPNTGPAGDHTTGTGYYSVWQQSGSQRDEWLLAQSHVTLRRVHQVILEATVGGEAGDIAIDDISLIYGPYLCDFEESSCNWQQATSDDSDWIRQSGSTLNPNTGPESDHTTNTPTGHYYYLPSSMDDHAGQKALMSSPLYPKSKGSCVQLWYHMYGEGMGMLNVYQQNEDGKEVLIFSQAGDQGRLWRFAQASLLPRIQPYRIVVEGVKAGPTMEGDMAFDDVQLTDAQCLPHGVCDFETSFCSWSNLGDGVDQGDWLLGAGASPNPNTGPTFDHTTNSSYGHYIYVDSSVGEWGDMSYLVSEVFHPSSRGHCLTFWYHMYGSHVGTLKVYINDRSEEHQHLTEVLC